MATKNSKSKEAECRFLFPTEYYNYRTRTYITNEEPDVYSYEMGDLFCSCCGADFDAKLEGPSKFEFGNDGITVYARHVDDISHDEVVVEQINTKNGPLTIATAISWEEYEECSEDEDW